MVAQDVHPREIMVVLGHGTIALTMNTYSHVLPRAHRVALDALSGGLFAPGGV